MRINFIMYVINNSKRRMKYFLDFFTDQVDENKID